MSTAYRIAETFWALRFGKVVDRFRDAVVDQLRETRSMKNTEAGVQHQSRLPRCAESARLGYETGLHV